MFGEKGYTTVEIDITAPTSAAPDSGTTVNGPLPSMASVLAGQIRLMAIPFPPILIASGSSCLLAQQYVGDNPVSGLVMLDAPSDAPTTSSRSGDDWPVFKYEPSFPILIMAGRAGLETLPERSRVAKAAENGVNRGGKGVSLAEIVDGNRGEKTRTVSPSYDLSRGEMLTSAFRRSRGGWTDVATKRITDPYVVLAVPLCSQSSSALRLYEYTVLLSVVVCIHELQATASHLPEHQQHDHVTRH